MGTLKDLSDILFSGNAGSSYVELDKRMKAKLNIRVVAILIIVTTLVILFYFKEPAKEFLQSIIPAKTDTNPLGELPKWKMTLFGIVVIFIVLIIIELVSSLIDKLKIHYKLDKITFKVIEKQERLFHERLLIKVGCGDKAKCALREGLISAKMRRNFMHEFFYFYANSNKIGDYNQKDKRMGVFNEWTKYYLFNFTSIAFCIIYIWVSLQFIKTMSLLLILSLIVGFAFSIWLYIKRGQYYRQKLFEEGLHQLDIIFAENPNQAKMKLIDIFGACPLLSCKLSKKI